MNGAGVCPGGVSFHKLGDIGTFYGGLTGKNKRDFEDGNARFATYLNVYTNPELQLDDEARVRISEGEKQNMLSCGDVIFTASSETREECGMSSVVMHEPAEPLYLNSFCYFWRPHDPEMLLPRFAKHLFRSGPMRRQIVNTANGVTRFNVSKALMAEVVVSVPPMSAQVEIAKTLDALSEATDALISALQREKVERSTQYRYVRDHLLSFVAEESVEDRRIATMVREMCPDGVPRRRLDEIATIERGGNFQKRDFRDDGVPCIHYGQIHTRFGTWTDKALTYVTPACAKKQRRARPGDIVMAVTSEDVKGACTCVAWLGEEEVAVGGHTAIIRHTLNPKYLSYWFQTQAFASQKRALAHGTKVIEVTPSDLGQITLPVPPEQVQDEIVQVLDELEARFADLDRAISEEVSARQTQFDHYRDALLTFKEKG